MTKTAVIYARYSSNRQREESIEGHIRQIGREKNPLKGKSESAKHLLPKII